MGGQVGNRLQRIKEAVVPLTRQSCYEVQVQFDPCFSQKASHIGENTLQVGGAVYLFQGCLRGGLNADFKAEGLFGHTRQNFKIAVSQQVSGDFKVKVTVPVMFQNELPKRIRPPGIIIKGAVYQLNLRYIAAHQKQEIFLYPAQTE